MASPQPTTEPHDLGEEDFLAETHSFEFWFQSVEGYLHDRPYGHRAETPEPELDEGARDRLITTLCNYCVGELAALDGASGLVQIAPNQATKVFLATQAVDEARHVEVLFRRLRALGVANPMVEIERRQAPALAGFRRRLLQLVRGKDWEAALFAQNVILEAMEFTVFQTHAQRADPLTAEVLEGIIKDERRHIGFGENELGRRLAAAPHARERLAEVRRELDPMVLQSFRETMDRLVLAPDERPELGRAYLAAVERLGFTP